MTTDATDSRIVNYLVERISSEMSDSEESRFDFPDHDLDFRTDDRADIEARAIFSMKTNGCVLLRGFVPPAEIEALRNSCNALLERSEVASHIDQRRDYETNEFFVNCTFDRVPGGHHATPTTLYKFDKPIINVRSEMYGPGGNEGLVDIFNVDRLFPDLAATFHHAGRTEFIRRVLDAASGRSYHPALFNLYINRSILETTEFHSDGLDGKVKVFTYLSDVETPADGPYTFARGTHCAPGLRDLNTEINENIRDVRPSRYSYFDRQRVIHAFGKMGDMVMSFQLGAHRGWPQEAGHSRMALVQSFLPEGEEP